MLGNLASRGCYFGQNCASYLGQNKLRNILLIDIVQFTFFMKLLLFTVYVVFYWRLGIFCGKIRNQLQELFAPKTLQITQNKARKYIKFHS